MRRITLTVVSVCLVILSATSSADSSSVIVVGSGYSPGYGLSSYPQKTSSWRSPIRQGHEYQTYRVGSGYRNFGYARPGYRYDYPYRTSYAGTAVSTGYFGYNTAYYQSQSSYYLPYHTLNGYPYAVYPQNVEVDTAVDVTIDLPETSGQRTLLKTADGLCYQIHKNQLGDELRIQLENRECNW